jgi:hypothetical protein
VEGRPAGREVEDRDPCAGIAAARLADGSRVEHDRLVALQGHRARALAQERPPPHPDRHGSVGVAEDQDVGRRRAGGELPQFLASPLLADDVLLGVRQRAVVVRDAVVSGSQRKLAEHGARVVFEHVAGPAQARARERYAALVAEPVEHHEVVVAGDTRARKGEDAANALVRVGAVAHEVSRAQVTIDALAREERQRRIEGVQVAVDVGDDPDARHLRTRRHAACHSAPRKNGMGSSRESPEKA